MYYSSSEEDEEEEDERKRIVRTFQHAQPLQPSSLEENRCNVPSLQEYCIRKMALHLNLYSLSNLVLPEFVYDRLTLIFRKQIEARNSSLTDNQVGALITLLTRQLRRDERNYHWTDYLSDDDDDDGTFDQKRDSLDTKEADERGGVESALTESHLTTLNLPWSDKLTKSGITTICEMCPFIKHLDLSFCTELGDDAVKILADSCAHLTTLNLTYCGKLTDKSCHYLARGNTQTSLRSLFLEECDNISDLGLQAIARGICRKAHGINDNGLREIAVGGCNITNVGIGILASHGGLLMNISLSGCKVTDFDVEDIARHCHSLRRLHLRACRLISDKALLHLARLARRQEKKRKLQEHSAEDTNEKLKDQKRRDEHEHKNRTASASSMLVKLDLGGCSQISNKGVNAILTSAPMLLDLDLRGCKSLTPQGIIPNVLEHKSLKRVVLHHIPNMPLQTLQNSGIITE
eukprot:g238.t1